MKFSIFERLMLLNCLPKEGDYTTLLITRQLRESLSFSEDEHKKLKFKETEGRVAWNANVNIIKDIKIGEKAREIISGSLKKLNEAKKLTEGHLTLYERFVEKK